jgi:hypothetical protein
VHSHAPTKQLFFFFFFKTQEEANKMGCDIHGHIEYKRWEETNVIGTPYWNFAENLGGRDYAMFGLLAGVRGKDCMFEPRGIPENISWNTKSAFCLRVNDEYKDGEGYTSQAHAEQWVKEGYSRWMDDEHTQISHPDWHTPSWVTTEEFERALNKRKEYQWQVDPEWDAILGAMKALPEARFVFWFDN